MSSQLDSGSTIAGRYALGEVLGRGAMGEVHAGRDLRLDRDVAIKLLNADVAVRRNSRERFETEARAAARLNHPSIVLGYDSGEHDGVPYLVWSDFRGALWRTNWRTGPCRLSGSADSRPTCWRHSGPPTVPALCIGTSSPATCSSAPMARPRWRISASPRSLTGWI